MKKLVFSLAAVAAMATGGFLGYSSGDSDSKLSSVMMANIEALARTEINWGSACMRFYTPWNFTPDPALWVRLCLPCGEEVFATSASSPDNC